MRFEPSLPWGIACCDNGHPLDRCARRLHLMPIPGLEPASASFQSSAGPVCTQLRCPACGRWMLSSQDDLGDPAGGVALAEGYGDGERSHQQRAPRPFTWLEDATATDVLGAAKLDFVADDQAGCSPEAWRGRVLLEGSCIPDGRAICVLCNVRCCVV